MKENPKAIQSKILIIDDDPHTIAIVKSRLTAHHYSVFSALDGCEGLEQIEKEKPDLILLDVLMPKMDGFTFLRTLKRDDRFKKIPVIVLTGKDRVKDLFVLEGIQESDFILKPYQPEKLLERIAQKLSVHTQV